MSETVTESSVVDLATELIDLTNESNSNSSGIVDSILDSKVFFLEPWFMGICVIFLLIIIVVTILYTMLFQRNRRRNSREAILNMTEDQTISDKKCSWKKPCIIVILCTLVILLIVGTNWLVDYLRTTDVDFNEFCSNIWSNITSVVVEPWLIGILFGIILLILVIATLHSILKEKKSGQKTSKNINRRTRKKGLFKEPWFIAFLCALLLIVILSVALFCLSCRKAGEKFAETASRFFLMEPWFFGIVVGVILLTLIIFNLYRILHGTGQKYSVNNNDEVKNQEIVIESQGFDEYPSKLTENNNFNNNENQTMPTINSQSSTQQQQPINLVKTKTTSPVIQGQANLQNVPPSLSLQLQNDGHFYDEKQFHDEDDSMAEYGLGEENELFNDEGSFIGLYNRDRIQNYMAQFNKNNLNN